MYHYLLIIHNILRWVFLAAAVYAIIRAIRGSSGNLPFSKPDNTAGAILLGTAHTQLLTGLILWFVSPVVQSAIADMAAAMREPGLRFAGIEHPLTMLIAIAIIQVGRIKAKKAYADADKHKRCLIYYSIGLLLVLSRIPWDKMQPGF